MPLSWSMDKIGPICRSIEDCALVFDTIHGRDGLDGTVVDRPFQWPSGRDIRTLRVGYIPSRTPDEERNELTVLKELGVQLVPIELPQRFPANAMTLILDAEAARAFGLREGQVTAMIHSGSRGLGHQVCTDHVQGLEERYKKTSEGWYAEEWDITLPDRQLASAPFYSREGQAYFEAMQAAGNYAFANRSALTQRLRDTLRAHLGTDGELEVIYDVCHNIAKIEAHVVHDSSCTCCVHQKGATRALGGDHAELAAKFNFKEIICNNLMCPKINIKLINSFSLERIIFFPNSVK